MWRLIRWLFKLLVFLCVVGAALWFGIKYYFTYVDKISVRVRNNVQSQVNLHHSRFLTYSEIPSMYRNAVIATEDRSFAWNIGINFRGIGRAIFVDVGQQQTLQGGSTITQQLVHNALLNDVPKSLSWKLKETLYSIGLYDTVSKPDTFAMYANDIYFGHGAYGLYAAAETYFGRPPSQLNQGELTMLAGLPNAPSDYDPFRNMYLARQRQQLVVQSMVDNGVLTASQGKQILSLPIRLK